MLTLEESALTPVAADSSLQNDTEEVLANVKSAKVAAKSQSPKCVSQLFIQAVEKQHPQC